MALNVIVLGPPGAGKGTQAERFARTRGIPKISTGDMLRSAAQAGTETGLRAKAVMDRGELVSDDLMIAVVRERLGRDDARHGFVLDGFPRTVPQAQALDGILDRRGPLLVIDIAVPDEELVRRLGARLICADCGANADAIANAAAVGADNMVLAPAPATALGAVAVQATAEPMRCKRCGGRLVQRADDNANVVRQRLTVYHRDTKPLVDFYRARPTFLAIDGAQPPEVVAAALARAVDALSSEAMTGDSR